MTQSLLLLCKDAAASPFTDDNEPSLHHQLIKPTRNSLINKVSTASFHLRPGGQPSDSRCYLLSYISHYILLTTIKYTTVAIEYFMSILERCIFYQFYQETKNSELWFYSLGVNIQDDIYVCIITRKNRKIYIYITKEQQKWRCSNAISMAQNIRHEVANNSDLTSWSPGKLF